jgi:hypothetical protein
LSIAVSRRHRRCFVVAILCLRLRRTCPLGERQVPKSGPGIPRSTAPRTVAPGLTAPPTWTPGLTAPPTWADSAAGIMRIAATTPIIESLPSIILSLPWLPLLDQTSLAWDRGQVPQGPYPFVNRRPYASNFT